MARRNAVSTKTRERTPATRTGGRPTALTPRVQETLVGYLADGLSVSAACALTGINDATFYRWMQRGEDARTTLDDTGSLPDEEDRFREFREAALEARARAERLMVGIVVESAKGGQLLSEEPMINPLTGELLYDPDTGKPYMRRTYSSSNGNLALRYMERVRPKDYSIRAQVEVGGKDGGPVQVEHTVEQVVNLHERLATLRARGTEAEEDARIGDGDVWDADVVEDGDGS
jgi:hypothetical protein